MEVYHIEESIEKRPTILGIKSVFFIIWFCSIIVSIMISAQLRSWWLAMVMLVLMGVLYLWFWIKTNDFVANKSTDVKLPEIIYCNPEED